jgi:hypothetical protein
MDIREPRAETTEQRTAPLQRDRWRQTVLHSLALLSLVLLLAAIAWAQDPLKADPAHFRLEFENDQVRVVRLYFGPYYRSVMNQTPARVVVFLTDAHFKVTDPKGVSTETHLRAGTAFWDDGGGKGIPGNLSDKPFEILSVVPKAHSKATNR